MADTYNVFISWSGERSKKVAAALYDWLPMVVQSARPWMSEEDIEKGSRGLEEIGKALESMSVGIICLTPENLEKPWILFETGALSKALGDKTRVCPYLYGDLRPENVKPPLGMFQATRAAKEDTRKLVSTVNRVLRGALAEEKLDTLFEGMWPELEKKLGAVPKAAAAAAPLRSEREMLAELLELSRAATGDVGWSKEALMTLLSGMNRLVSRARLTGEDRTPLTALGGGARSGVADAKRFWADFVESAMTEPAGGTEGLGGIAEVIAAGPEEASPEERAARARLIREFLLEKKEQGSETAKRADDEKK